MELAITIWLIGVTNTLHFIMLACIAGAGSLAFMLYISSAGYQVEVSTRMYKQIGWVAIVCGVVLTVLPSERTAWLMVGGYFTQSIVESSISSKLKQIAEVKLDEILADMTKTSKK